VKTQVQKVPPVQKRLSYRSFLIRKKDAQVVFFPRTLMSGSSSCFRSRSRSL